MNNKRLTYAWWNGVFTVALVTSIVGIGKGLWRHDMDGLIVSACFSVLFLFFCVALAVAALDE